MNDDIRPASEPGAGGVPGPTDTQEQDAPPSEDGVWSAASLLMGAVPALMIVPGWLLAQARAHSSFPGPDGSPLQGCCGDSIAAMLLMSVAGVLWGVRSMYDAVGARRSVALGLAGMMLNALNLLMWTGALLVWYSYWK